MACVRKVTNRDDLNKPRAFTNRSGVMSGLDSIVVVNKIRLTVLLSYSCQVGVYPAFGYPAFSHTEVPN